MIENCVLQSLSFKDTVLDFEDVNIADFKFNGIEWGRISDKKVCPELIRNNPAKARDIYRQLKFALDNQKDFITANEFYALEMKAHSRVICREFPSKEFWRRWQDLLVLLFYGCVSNYGQSWFKPLIAIIGVTLIATWLLYGLPDFTRGVENFFKTLNLFKVKETATDGRFYYTIRSLHAILMTYFTYQLIIAVRRKTKR